jgi:hypothetical protein
MDLFRTAHREIGKHAFCVVSEFEAKAIKGQLSNENPFLFNLGGTPLKEDADSLLAR